MDTDMAVFYRIMLRQNHETRKGLNSGPLQPVSRLTHCETRARLGPYTQGTFADADTSDRTGA
jgi:hypothetical protein